MKAAEQIFKFRARSNCVGVSFHFSTLFNYYYHHSYDKCDDDHSLMGNIIPGYIVCSDIESEPLALPILCT